KEDVAAVTRVGPDAGERRPVAGVVDGGHVGVVILARPPLSALTIDGESGLIRCPSPTVVDTPQVGTRCVLNLEQYLSIFGTDIGAPPFLAGREPVMGCDVIALARALFLVRGDARRPARAYCRLFQQRLWIGGVVRVERRAAVLAEIYHRGFARMHVAAGLAQ